MIAVYCIRLALTVHKIKEKVKSLPFHPLSAQHHKTGFSLRRGEGIRDKSELIRQSADFVTQSQESWGVGGWERWLGTCESDAWQGFQLKRQFSVLAAPNMRILYKTNHEWRIKDGKLWGFGRSFESLKVTKSLLTGWIYMRPQSGHDVTPSPVLGSKVNVINSGIAQLGAIDRAAGLFLLSGDILFYYWNGSHFK